MSRLTTYSYSVGIVAVNSPNFVQECFNHLHQGEVVVPLRSDNDEQRIKASRVDRIITPKPGFGWISETPITDDSDRIAQIMFTSGTEGEPKGVELTYKGLADVVARLNSIMQVDSSIREYIGIPVYHSFGFGRCRAVAAAGGRAYIPENGFNPIEIANMLRDGSINAISAVPSLWRILLAANVINLALGKKVRWIEIGSQYMSRSEKEQLKKLFSNAVIVQHYGLTEASRSTFLDISSLSGEQLESVGRAIGDVELRITDEGRIAIRGPHVTRHLLIQDKHQPALDNHDWYQTNDLGELRDGMLYYRGRADDVINCSGLKLSPETLEARVRHALELSEGFAICRIPDPIRGDGILIAALSNVTVPDTDLQEAVANAAQESGVNVRGSIHVLRTDNLPRTASGKIQRKLITAQFTTQSVPSTSETSAKSQTKKGQESIRDIYKKYLGVPIVTDTDSFVHLGGDSLAYIRTSVALESRLGYLPKGWENMTVLELNNIKATPHSLSRVEPMVWLRALAIMTIAANGANLFGTIDFPGGAYLLFVLAGASFARFQLQKVLQEGKPIAILAGLPRILIPAMLLLLVEQVRHSPINAAPVLLISNFINPELGGKWFIETWVQIYVLTFLLFTLTPITAKAKQKPLYMACIVFIAALAIRVLAPLLWDTQHLYNRVPQAMYWLFAMGWVAMASEKNLHRWLLTLAAVVLVPLLMWSTGPRLWVGLGTIGLIWAPALPMPSILAKAISWVSAASLYIYMTDYYFFSFAERLLPGYLAPSAGWLLALIAGGVMQIVAEHGWKYLMNMKYKLTALQRI